MIVYKCDICGKEKNKNELENLVDIISQIEDITNTIIAMKIERHISTLNNNNFCTIREMHICDTCCEKLHKCIYSYYDSIVEDIFNKFKTGDE